MYLVQRHPNLGQTGHALNVAELPHMPELASKTLQAFDVGWTTRLPQFSGQTQCVAPLFQNQALTEHCVA